MGSVQEWWVIIADYIKHAPISDRWGSAEKLRNETLMRVKYGGAGPRERAGSLVVSY